MTAWTQDEVSRAMELRALGHSFREIEAVMDRSWYAIRNKLRDMAEYAVGLTCADCSTPIRATRNRAGRCSRCILISRNADPEYQAKRAAALSVKWSDPNYKAKMRAESRAHAIRLAKDPRVRAARRRAGKAAIARLFEPEVRAKTLKAVSERAGKTNSERRMAWCPAEYRHLYRYLVKTKRIPGSEARKAVFEQVKADRERAATKPEESLSPFERQERALARGAKLVANDRGPSFGEAADYGERRWEVGRVA